MLACLVVTFIQPQYGRALVLADGNDSGLLAGRSRLEALRRRKRARRYVWTVRARGEWSRLEGRTLERAWVSVLF